MCDLDTFMNKKHLKSIYYHKFETKLLLINQNILEKLGKVIRTAVNVRGALILFLLVMCRKCFQK